MLPTEHRHRLPGREIQAYDIDIFKTLSVITDFTSCLYSTRSMCTPGEGREPGEPLNRDPLNFVEGEPSNSTRMAVRCCLMVGLAATRSPSIPIARVRNSARSDWR